MITPWMPHCKVNEVVTPLEQPTVGQVVEGEKTRGLDDVEDSVVVLECVAEGLEGAIETLLAEDRET